MNFFYDATGPQIKILIFRKMADLEFCCFSLITAASQFLIY